MWVKFNNPLYLVKDLHVQQQQQVHTRKKNVNGCEQQPLQLRQHNDLKTINVCLQHLLACLQRNHKNKLEIVIKTKTTINKKHNR